MNNFFILSLLTLSLYLNSVPFCYGDTPPENFSIKLRRVSSSLAEWLENVVDKQPLPQETPLPLAEESTYTIVEYRSYRVPLPEGYTLKQQEPLGEGQHALVFLVDDKQGKTWALKVFKSHYRGNGPRNEEELDEELKLVSQWQLFGNPVHAFSIEGRMDIILKSYIEGHTLKSLIENGLFCIGEKSIYQQKLIHFLKMISKEKMIFDDLNPGNLIFSDRENKWVVIDSKLGTKSLSEEKSLQKNITLFVNKLLISPSFLIFKAVLRFKRAINHGRNTPNYNAENYALVLGFTRQLKKEKF